MFNIGGIEEISIKDLAYKIVEKAGSSSQVKLIPYEDAFPADFEDMQRRLPSIEKLKNLTGYAPTTDLNSILDKVIEFFRHKA